MHWVDSKRDHNKIHENFRIDRSSGTKVKVKVGIMRYVNITYCLTYVHIIIVLDPVFHYAPSRSIISTR